VSERTSPCPGILEARQLIGLVRSDIRRVAAATLVMHAMEKDFVSRRGAEFVAPNIEWSQVRTVLHHSR
jgi:hypothetical protein